MKEKMKSVLAAALMLVVLNPVQSSAMHIMEGFLPKQWSLIWTIVCLLYTSPSPRDRQKSRMPSSA